MRDDPVREVARRDRAEPGQRPVGHRHVYDLALAGARRSRTRPPAVPLAQRGHDPEGSHTRAPAEVGYLPRRLHRLARVLARQPEQADQSEVVHVVAGCVALWTLLAVAGDRAVDDARILLAHPLVTDAEPADA